MGQLDATQRVPVLKAIKKVSMNPLPESEGGYGKPLGNKGVTDLSGLLKIKLKQAGIRVVYQVIRTETEMLVVVISARSDDEVYTTAQYRAKSHHLARHRRFSLTHQTAHRLLFLFGVRFPPICGIRRLLRAYHAVQFLYRFEQIRNKTRLVDGKRTFVAVFRH